MTRIDPSAASPEATTVPDRTLLEPMKLELVAKMRWLQHTGRRLAIVLEGRDTAGKGGVVEAIAMSSGDTTPEGWVPADVVSYTTMHWKLDETFDVVAKLYNSLMNEGAFQGEVQSRVSERIGVDFEKEVLPALDGRFTLVQYTRTPRLAANSPATPKFARPGPNVSGEIPILDSRVCSSPRAWPP